MSMLNSKVVLTAVSALAISLSPLIAQSSFPPANKTLYDVKHKEQKSGVESDGKTILIHPGVGTSSTINVLTFSQDGRLLAAGKDFGRIVVWDVSTGKVFRVIESKQNIVSAIAISPDSQFLASAGSEEHPVIAIWDLVTGKVKKTISVDKPVVQKLTFAEDGRSLIVTENGIAYVFDAVSGRLILDLSGDRLPVLSVDGDTMLTTSGQKFTLWNTRNWVPIKTFPSPAKYAWPLAIDTQQNLLVYGSPNEKQGFSVIPIPTDSPSVAKRQYLSMQFNPSADYFATIAKSSYLIFGHSGGRLWSWNIDTGKTCISPVLYSESGELSADGRILAGAIDNGILSRERVEPGVEMWDVPALLKGCDLN